MDEWVDGWKLTGNPPSLKYEGFFVCFYSWLNQVAIA